MNRKSFLKKAGAISTVFTGVPFLASNARSQVQELTFEAPAVTAYGANDQINVALIGAGGMGQGNGVAALNHSGVRMVAACDLYHSRLQRCRERWGEDLFITRDYREILERSDIDAVIISSSDHWHDIQAIDSMNKGKAVFLEKPMVQHVEQGHDVIRAEKQSGQILQIGSQLTSDIVYKKVRELLLAGEIGELNVMEGVWNRYSAGGAWQYSIPPGVSEREVDWDTYLKDLPHRPFDPKQFFRWRNYQDFGTGVAGDLFVHLISALHMITDADGPSTIMSTGGLRFWKDGRDVPDVIMGLYDYEASEHHPAFNVTFRVNFIDGSGGGQTIRLVGSEGELLVSGREVRLRKGRLDLRPPVTIGDFCEKTQEEYLAYHSSNYPAPPPGMIAPSEFIYRTPEGYNSRVDHFGNFFAAMREGKSVLQDGTFGLRAAAPALLTNVSYEQKKVIRWDPKAMRVI